MVAPSSLGLAGADEASIELSRGHELGPTSETAQHNTEIKAAQVSTNKLAAYNTLANRRAPPTSPSTVTIREINKTRLLPRRQSRRQRRRRLGGEHPLRQHANVRRREEVLEQANRVRPVAVRRDV